MANPKIATRARSFAVGLALREKSGTMTFVKVFQHTEGNDDPVRDFFRILAEASLYKGGNEVIEISKKQAQNLLDDFKKHVGTLEFLASIGKRGGVIVVMHYKHFPKVYEEAALLEALTRPKPVEKEKNKENKKKKK